MLSNRYRIYKIAGGRVFPDRLSEQTAEACIGDWLVRIAQYIGTTRDVCEKALPLLASKESDRWETRRLTGLRQIFLDSMHWSQQKGEIQRARLLALVNAQTLLGCRTIEECFMLPRAVLKAPAATLGYASVEALEVAAKNDGTCKVLSGVENQSVDSISRRYDLAQLQAALFNCNSATVEVRAEFKHFVRAARLCGFELSLADITGGHRIKIGNTSHYSGPKGYGCGLSKLANTLVNLSEWRLDAEFEDHVFRASLQVASNDGYSSCKSKVKTFDSTVEKTFWERWHMDDRRGWRLIREPRLHAKGSTIFCPDFEVERNGRVITIEIVGKNDPSYYGPKFESLRTMLPSRSILLVKTQMAEIFSGLPAVIVPYANVPNPADVVAALEQLATP